MEVDYAIWSEMVGQKWVGDSNFGYYTGGEKASYRGKIKAYVQRHDTGVTVVVELEGKLINLNLEDIDYIKSGE